MKPLLTVVANIYIKTTKAIYKTASLFVPRHRYPSIVSDSHTLPAFWVLLAVALPATGQTCVVVYRTPTEVVVGADSKGTFATNKSISKSACKIIPIDNIAFACSGFVADARTGYDMQIIASSAARQPGSLTEKVRKFEQLVKPELANDLEHLKRTSAQESK